jgi:hypothetical protein
MKRKTLVSLHELMWCAITGIFESSQEGNASFYRHIMELRGDISASTRSDTSEFW